MEPAGKWIPKKGNLLLQSTWVRSTLVVDLVTGAGRGACTDANRSCGAALLTAKKLPGLA